MSNEFRRILFGTQGGFPLAQEDLEALQMNLFDNIGMLAVGTCLGQSNVIFGSAPVHNGSTLNIAGCYVLLNGVILSCPAQNIAGADAGKFWMLSEPVTDTPLQFQDGSVRDTRELRTAKIIYADAQPAGGVRVADMKVYTRMLTDSLVKPITDPLSQTATNHAQAIAANVQGIAANAQAIGGLAQAIGGLAQEISAQGQAIQTFGQQVGNKADKDLSEDAGWVDLSSMILLPGVTSPVFMIKRRNNVVSVNISLYGLQAGSDKLILTLPEEYRPTNILYPSWSGSLSQGSDLIFNLDGKVVISTVQTGGAYMQTLVTYVL